MATQTTDFEAVLAFIDEAKVRDCYLPTPDVPDPQGHIQQLSRSIAYLGLGLKGWLHQRQDSAPQTAPFQAFVTGWTELEGVMLLTEETEFDADVRVAIAARNERALRDLLLAFPARQVGFFYLSSAWMLPALDEILDGHRMPAREGYFATTDTFTPQHDYPARRLVAADYPLVQTQWSASVWNELLEGGYSIHACQVAEALCALCFHWQVAAWRNEVHGLQAVKDYARPFATSAVTSATAEVLAQGKIATCTANLSTSEDYLRAFRQVGYRPFYRVHSYLGAKRGSGFSIAAPTDDFFRTTPGRKSSSEKIQSLGNGGQIQKSKDPLLIQFAALGHAAGRRERSQFLVEGITLTRRAIQDGLPMDSLLYTPELAGAPEGVLLLHDARQAGIAHYRVTEGLMGKVTTTRPVPSVLAAVWTRLRTAEEFTTATETPLLIAEDIHNPDNLGMLLRTADAAGVQGVLVVGARSDPFHKNCVRAARGAVGRIPILCCHALEAYLSRLQMAGFEIVGAALGADRELYRCRMLPPLAVIVGNEQEGISRPILEACTARVQIPMAPGQDSLNVGVAAGLMLYEVFRQKEEGDF
jgi:tRNA G18 (ribose-2'-O)-methylase SpoU